MDSNYEKKRKQRTVKKKLKRGLETEREKKKLDVRQIAKGKGNIEPRGNGNERE